MKSRRASTLGALLLLLSAIRPATAQTPPLLRGLWQARSGADELRRLDLTDTGAAVTWRNETLQCEMLAIGGNLPATLAAATFRCATASGPLYLGITRPPEMLLLVNVVSPVDPVMKLVVMTRPTAAARPPLLDRGESKTPPIVRDESPIVRPPAGDAIPQFPWPPPKWTLRTVLPQGLAVTAEGEPLGKIFDRLIEALRRAQISEWSVYGVGTDGFALVARLEHIDEGGRPAADRWAGTSRPQGFSIGDYIKALFSASPGRYRVIVFVATAKAVVSSAQPADREALDRLWRGGPSTLPPSIRRIPLPPSGRVEALVYEFYRRSQDDPVTQVMESGLTVPRHLSGAGLWPIEVLTR